MLASRLLGRGTHPVCHSERSEESLLGAPIEEEESFLVASLLGTTGAQAKRVMVDILMPAATRKKANGA